MNEELAEWCHPRHTGQRLNIWMEVGKKWCASGVYIGTVPFNFFNNNVSSEIKWTLNKFADDTQLSGAVDLFE